MITVGLMKSLTLIFMLIIFPFIFLSEISCIIFVFFPLFGQITQRPISIVGVNLLRDKTNQDCQEDSMSLVNQSQGGQMTNWTANTRGGGGGGEIWARHADGWFCSEAKVTAQLKKHNNEQK